MIELLETIAQRKDGAVFPIELSVSEVRGLNLFTGIVRDIFKSAETATSDHHDRREAEASDGLELHDDIGQELTGSA